LKGFTKVSLKPGETRTVGISLGPNALAYYDPGQKSWVAQKGSFQIMVGGSSHDLPLKEQFSLPQTLTFR